MYSLQVNDHGNRIVCKGTDVRNSYRIIFTGMPVGEPLPVWSDWRIVAVVQTRDAAMEWVKVEQSATALLAAHVSGGIVYAMHADSNISGPYEDEG